jgi:ABC-2 type transport system permease protein
MTRRIATLIGKELREFRASPSAIIPVLLVVVVTLAIPFLVLVLVPSLTGENIANDPAIVKALSLAVRYMPALSGLSPEAAAEAFLFQQFLMLFLLAPIVGAVSLAAYSVVGEKQGRTLEPLLTTPLTTTEILLGKVLASFVPALVIEAIGVTLYFALMAIFALPGVAPAVLVPRTFILLGVIGPLAALAALQATIAVSSRVNDPRSAQQIAVVLVLPLVAMLIGQIAGAFILTTGILLAIALFLAIVWVLLVLLSVALFDRETILTRWT